MQDNTEQQKMPKDWKDKKGFDFQERLSLKIDQKQAEKYKQRHKKRNLKNNAKPANLKAGLNKLRKKVREAYDEEDEDENDYFFVSQPRIEGEEDDRALFNGLTEDEKRILKQKETIHNVQMQQTAGKMEALQTADLLAKETLNRSIERSVLNSAMQKAVFDPQETHEDLVQKKVSSKLGVRGKIEDGKIIQAARGVKKVQQMGGTTATKDLEMKDVVRAGEGKLSDRELAKLILEKSGQDVEKYQPKHKKEGKKTELKHLKPARPVSRRKEVEY